MATMKWHRRGSCGDNVTWELTAKLVHERKLRVRPTNIAHKQITEWADSFLLIQYGADNRYISFSTKGLDPQITKNMRAKLMAMPLKKRVMTAPRASFGNCPEGIAMENENRAKDTVYVDGMHREAALERDDVYAVYPLVAAWWYYRKDLKSMTDMDIVSLGQSLNEVASATIVRTPLDRLYGFHSLMVSVVKSGVEGALNDREREIIKSIIESKSQPSVKDVFNLCIGRKLDLLLSPATRRIYCRIAFGAWKFGEQGEDLILCLKHISSLKVVSSFIVWDAPTVQAQQFDLQCIMHTFGPGKKTNGTIAHGRVIANKALYFWSNIECLGKEHNVALEDIMKIEVPAKAQRQHARLVTITERLNRFIETVKPDEFAEAEYEDAVTGRIDNFFL